MWSRSKYTMGRPIDTARLKLELALEYARIHGDEVIRGAADAEPGRPGDQRR